MTVSLRKSIIEDAFRGLRFGAIPGYFLAILPAAKPMDGSSMLRPLTSVLLVADFITELAGKFGLRRLRIDWFSAENVAL